MTHSELTKKIADLNEQLKSHKDCIKMYKKELEVFQQVLNSIPPEKR